MILADTSIWVNHLRKHSETLAALLNKASVLSHPFVIGELALGQMQRRSNVLAALSALPQAVIATDAEALDFIERHTLHGRGIGYVDVHLLAATRLTPGTKLWTADKRLAAIAEEQGLAAAPPFDATAWG